MNKQRALLGFTLFAMGMLGILSTLTMDIPLPPEVETLLKQRFTSQQIKLLTLVNPAIMLLIAVVLGTILYPKVPFKVPLIERIVGIHSEATEVSKILKDGVLGGVVAGVLIGIVGMVFNPLLPAEFVELGESLKPTLAARFLYGGFTEELLIRFGLMTLVVWVATKIAKGATPAAYWIGIILTSIVFALGHFPIAFQAVGNPSVGLLTYILIGNTIGGIVFGWLYWKRGLESAMVAHIFTHVVMVLSEPLLA